VLDVDVYLMQVVILLVIVSMCLSKLAPQMIDGPLKFTNVVLHAGKLGIHAAIANALTMATGGAALCNSVGPSGRTIASMIYDCQIYVYKLM
jgi:hypothetical protein